MKILAVVPSECDINPGQRYRIEQWEPFLRELGVDLTYSAFSFPTLTRVLYKPGRHLQKAALMMMAYFKQVLSVVRAHRFDLVYVFREATLLGPAVVESLIGWQGLPIVFDFDDAIFVPYKSPSNSYLSYLKCFGKTARVCELASQVIVGNRYLHDYAKKYNSEVTIIPTTVDTDWYRPERRRQSRDGIPIIGWTGSYSSYQYLERVFPALEHLSKLHRFRLAVVGTQAPVVPGVEVDFRPWCSATEVEDLADVDVGIMPLPDDPWSRGKCGLKALQYMGLGVPAVVSPVGVNTEIVSDGVNGLVAESENDWVQKLSLLLENRTLRERLGRAARKTVEERYSARIIAPRVFQVFGKALTERVSRAAREQPRKVS